MKKEQPKQFNIPKIPLTGITKGVVKHNKIKWTIRIIKYLFILSLLGIASYGIYAFNTNYSLQLPFRSPIVPREHKILISPVGHKKASMLIDLGKIADRIYTLESSGGKNDGCRDMGLYNGYGFRQNSREWVCYGSHEEVRRLVINRLTNLIKDGNVEKALCMYNEGLVKNTCTYSVNYLTLK